jgi:hypothetical protein
VGEFRSEVGSRRDFQKNFWQIHTRQSRIHSLPKLHQRFWLIEFVEWGYDEIILPIHLLYASAWIRGQICSHCAVGLIEFTAQGLNCLLG